MKRTNGILTLLSFFMTAFLIAGHSILQGKVWAKAAGTVKAEDGKPIAGVKVVLVCSEDGSQLETTTDDKGKWRLANVRPGRWTIGFMVEGFEPQSLNVEFLAVRDNPPIDIKLAAVPASPFVAADALYKEQKYAEALQEYEKVLAADPSSAEAQEKIGLCYYRLEDLENALAAFQKALEKSPGAHGVLINIGAIYLQMGNLEEGVKYVRQLDDARITDPNLFYNVGILFFKNGNADLAIEYLKKSLAVDSGFVDAYYQLGLANLNKGDMEEAKKNFQRVIDLVPGSEKAALAKQILDSIK